MPAGPTLFSDEFVCGCFYFGGKRRNVSFGLGPIYKGVSSRPAPQSIASSFSIEVRLISYLVAAAVHLLLHLWRLLWYTGYISFYKLKWADEEPVDPKQYLEDTCKPKCVRPLRAYQACVKRIKGDETGHKHCTGQYFDYWKCIDECVALKLFDKLK